MMEVNSTLIECKKSETNPPIFRFLIVDAPSPSSLPAYVQELQRYNVSHLVRVCGQTYKSELVERANITVHGWQFDDGAPPPQNVIDNWLNLLESRKPEPGAPAPTIAVHCVAGLGRAPILVAVGMVEYADFQPLDAVGYIRERRKGAINQVQLNWLMRYKPRSKKKQASKFRSCCGQM